MKTKVFVLRSLFIGIGIFCFLGLFVLISSIGLLNGIKSRKVAAVARHSRHLHLLSQPLSVLTLKSNATIETVTASLGILSQSEAAQQAVTEIVQATATQDIELQPLLQLVIDIQPELETLQKNLPNCHLCTSNIPSEYQTSLSQVLATALDISAASETLIEGEHSYLVLFQNSDELRATGGFIGSYARITIIDGHVLPITVEDIYAADGQFTGSIPAPPGVKEYLSSDRGLRLPDSNWEAHFPTSAKQVLQFFALGNSSNYEGVIVITDSYFQSLLELTGPIWLPDYQLSVTSENLGEVLRTDRDQFFAGSIQKQHLLEQFKNQLLIKLTADEFDFTQLLGITLQHATQKNILWYFTDENLQNIAHRFALDGALLGSDSPNFLGFIESNVGINKANKGISRALSLSKKGTTMTAYYYLENTNSPPQRTELQALVTDPDIKKTATAAATHLGYINYQRVVYPSGWQLTKIALPDQTQPQITTRNFSLSTGQSIQESGFLVTVPEQSATLLELTFTLPSDTSSNSLELYKQPGTSPVPIWLLSTDDQPFEGEPDLILEKNRVTML